MFVTGVGSLPGLHARDTTRRVFDTIAFDEPGLQGIPFLPELPARGPGAQMVGRSAALLVDMPVDLQRQGWRLVPHPGHDMRRTAAWWREDLDVLAEAAQHYQGPLKTQIVGPCTLASEMWLNHGDRVLSDPAAMRDLAQSLAEGVSAHVSHLRELVPGANVVVQIDEPSLGAVLAGRVPTSSGFSVLPAMSGPDAVQALALSVSAAQSMGASAVLHCCAPRPPIRVAQEAGFTSVNVDTSLLDRTDWEALGEAAERGLTLWAGLASERGPAGGTADEHTGVDPQVTTGEHPTKVADTRINDLLTWSDRANLIDSLTRSGAITPTCGWAGTDPRHLPAAFATLLDTARRVRDLLWS